MYCPNCGAHNENSYNNCISCGKYIGDINKTLRETQETENTATPEAVIEQEVKEQANFVEKIPESFSQQKAESKSAEFNKSMNESVYSGERKSYEPIYRQYVKKPKVYFILSIICTIFGSLGFGIAAIVFSVMTKAEIGAGNIKKAYVYSQNTKTFCIFSIAIGIIKYIFIILMISSYYASVNYYHSPFMW